MRSLNSSAFLLIVSFVAGLVASQPARADDEWPPALPTIDVTDSKRSPDRNGEEERHYTIHVDDHGVYEFSTSSIPTRTQVRIWPTSALSASNTTKPSSLITRRLRCLSTISTPFLMRAITTSSCT